MLLTPLSRCPTRSAVITHLLVQSQAIAEPPKGAHVKKAFSDEFENNIIHLGVPVPLL